MNVRSIIALFMGLVIQLSQVQLSLAADTATTCGDHRQAMSCCDGLRSCPCASESHSDQKPAPLVPVTVDLKLLVSKGSEPYRLEALISPPTNAVVLPASHVDPWNGYAGVPLSVAFCRFVI
jgi:hypothetical protein